MRARFQRYKPKLGRAGGKKELQISEDNEGENKSEADELELQKDESASTASAMVSPGRIITLLSKMWLQVACSII